MNTNKTKIFLITNMYPNKNHPYYGIFIKNSVDKLNSSDKIQINNIAKISGKKRYMFQKIYAYFLLYLNILIKGLFASFDIVYVHYLKYTVFPSFIISKVIRRKKLIFNAHGSDLIPENKNTIKLSPLKRYIISKCDGFIVPSEYYKNIILEELPNLKEKIFISPSGGIDTNVFYPEKNNQNSILTIGYVGRIDSGKGIEILINSFIELKKQRIEFKGYIIGNGSLFKHYEDEIIKLNLNHQVELLGAVEQNKLRKYYNAFDILVFPTYRASESLGLVALEAMACGTPVIGSNIGEIKNYIIDEVNGFLFDAKDCMMLTQKIIKYSTMSNAQKIKMRDEAIKTSKRYSSDFVTNGLVNYLEKIIEPKLI